MARRLLVTVAHPDDETFGCGSVLLHAAANGVATTVCCATRGEAGEPADGSGVGRDRLGEVRERELRAAATLLGVERVEVLGFGDSGMDGDAPAGSLAAAAPEQVVAALRSVVDEVRPHVVVTLSADDGHRDHVRIREATLSAVEAVDWAVERVYLQCLPRTLLRQWAELEARRRPDSPYLDVDAAGLGTPDEALTTIVDTSEHLLARRAAIACHRSQTSPFARLPEELERAFLGSDHLVRVRPVWTGGPTERDLLGAVASR